MNFQPLGNKSILDGRYEILSLTRKSEQGFLYHARNLLTEQQVLIKEYFPDEYVMRLEGRAVLRDSADDILFGKLTERFLKAARVIRDFSQMPGIIRILDYFKDRGTAYCVMEETGDVLLMDKIRAGQRINPESAFRAMVPVLESLDAVHRAGFLYRLIRPESTGITPKNLFRICDFGIPREIPQMEGHEKRLTKKETGYRVSDFGNRTRLSTSGADGYTPPERMESGMTQGPWSDLYSAAAVLYFSITGRNPEGAYERTLGERLTLPSDLGISIKPDLESILQKGLAVKKEKRYQSAEEMLRDIEKVLPKKDPESVKKERKRRRIRLAAVISSVLAFLLCCFGIYLYFHPGFLKFYGEETETVWLTAEKGTDESSLKEDWNKVRAKAEDIAGNDNYIWEEKNNEVRLIFPNHLFLKRKDISGNSTYSQLSEKLTEGLGKKITAYAEQKIRWESPKESPLPGKYQKEASFLIQSPVLLLYGQEAEDAAQTEKTGEWYRKITELKSMLDVLETPYAVGVPGYNRRGIVIKIDRNKIPGFYAEFLDRNMTLDLAAGWSCMYAGGLDRVEPYMRKDGKTGIRLFLKADGSMSDYEQELLKRDIRLAQSSGNKKLMLLIGELTIAEGKIPSQKEMESGILDFPDIILPDTKSKDIRMICRCLNRMNSRNAASDSGISYGLLRAQNIDGQGKPQKKQESFKKGNYRYLTSDEKNSVQSLAEMKQMKCVVTENTKTRSISFIEEESSEKTQEHTKAEVAERELQPSEHLKHSGTADQIRERLSTVADLMQGTLVHTRIRTLFWDQVKTDLSFEGGDYEYHIHAVLQPEDQIEYSYLKNPEISDSEEVSGQQYFGRLAVHGQVIRKKKNEGSAENTFEKLDEAVSRQKNDPDLKELQTFLQMSEFFREYGGSRTWECSGD